MNLEDTIRIIASYLDNDVLEKLYLSGAVPELASFFSDQHFWHDRVETITQKRVKYDHNIDWTETYQILNTELREEEASLWNKEDNVLAVRLLHSLGYIPRTSDLILAVENGSVNILHFLLQEGSVDPNRSEGRAGYPPITIAATEGLVLTFRLLLLDPRVDPTSEEGDTNALIEACAAINGDNGNYTEIVRLLLEDGRLDPTREEHQCLRTVSEYDDNVEIMKILLADKRIDPNSDVGSAIQYAAEMGREKIVKILLADPRVDPSIGNDDALRNSLVHEDTSITRLLLADPRVNPSVARNEPLRIAIGNDNVEMVKLILANPRTNIDADRNLLLDMVRTREVDEKIERLMLSVL